MGLSNKKRVFQGTNPSVEEKRSCRKAFISSMLPLLRDVSAKLGRSKGKWFLGEKMTHVDFLMYEFLVRKSVTNSMGKFCLP